MAKKQSPDRKDTTISIPKTLKANIRLYAKPLKDGKRYESDAMILDRIVAEYMKNNPPTNAVPKSTYKQKSP
ncbi:hypothetical protein [Nitrosopumilus sp.]|uniref:hypothetical protein n=1 Tax=Nitrosopumilus sp. TaxID=2024843 RepID=UPI003D0ED02F